MPVPAGRNIGGIAEYAIRSPRDNMSDARVDLLLTTGADVGLDRLGR